MGGDGVRPSSFRRKPESTLTLLLARLARTDSRPCVVCPPSMAASYFLLLAQKKVTKENGTLGAAPLAQRAVRYGWTGLAKRPSMASRPNRRDPSRRPRAGHAAGPSTLRRGFRGDPKGKSKAKEEKQTCRIYAMCLLRQGLPRSALPGPLSAAASRRRKSRAAIAGRMPATSTRAQGCAPGEALRVLAESRGHGCPRDRGREGVLFFGDFLLDKQKKVTGDQGWST